MFIKLVEDLKAAESLASVNAALEQYLLRCGISTYAFTYYSYHPNSQNKLKYDLTSADFKRWHKHYREEKYDDVDTTLDVVYSTTLPTYWDLQHQLAQAKSEREKQMRLDSIAYGIEKGISIPVHGPNEDFAILLLVQMKGQKCLEQWESLQDEFLAAAYYYYSYLQQQLLKAYKPSEKYKLNQREIQCLYLIAKKYSAKKMAEELNITERTVNFHVQRLNKKLGTKNKYQSLLKAMQEGLLVL